MRFTIILSTMLSTFLSLAVSGADSVPAAAEQEAAQSALQLPPELREKLIQEMRAVQGAMVELAEAIPQGRWKAVHNTGMQIHESFILKQTRPEQRRALRAALPADFRRRDAAFHRRAQQLANAARDADPEMVAYHFGRMTEACMGCHARYAADRFPGLAGTPAPLPGH